MSKESFIRFVKDSRQGPVIYTLGCIYAVGWILLFVFGSGVGAHESASAAFSYPVSIGRSAPETLYYRPWIGWFLAHGPLALMAVLPLAILVWWLRWRKSHAA
jgi:hypothetical protein